MGSMNIAAFAPDIEVEFESRSFVAPGRDKRTGESHRMVMEELTRTPPRQYQRQRYPIL